MKPTEDAIDQLTSLKDLDHPDWDSYGGLPVSRAAQEWAQIFVTHVWSVLGVRIPLDAGPRPDGGVSVLWRGRHNVKIEICFAPTQPAVPTYIVSEAGELKYKGIIPDVDAFAREILKPTV